MEVKECSVHIDINTASLGSEYDLVNKQLSHALSGIIGAAESLYFKKYMAFTEAEKFEGSDVCLNAEAVLGEVSFSIPSLTYGNKRAIWGIAEMLLQEGLYALDFARRRYGWTYKAWITVDYNGEDTEKRDYNEEWENNHNYYYV